MGDEVVLKLFLLIAGAWAVYQILQIGRRASHEEPYRSPPPPLHTRRDEAKPSLPRTPSQPYSAAWEAEHRKHEREPHR